MMEKPVAPWPLLQFAIEPKSRADEQKFRAALSKLAEERPDFQVKWDEESGQTIIAAMSEVDLDVITNRLRDEFEIGVNVSAPQVAYRETITHAREQDYTHKRIFGGKGEFARVKIAFEPNPESDEFLFEPKILDGAVPGEYVVGIGRGLRSIASSGPFAGFPMIGIKAMLVDGAYHETDSSASAFEIAGRAWFKEAAPRLGVRLLEPVMKVEVVVLEDYARDIVSELIGQRGKIQSQEPQGVDVVLTAIVPLASMLKLEDSLQSLSKSQARVSASYAGYAPVPFPDDDRDPPAAMAVVV